MSRKVIEELANLEKKGEELSQIILGLGFKLDIISSSYLDPGSKYGITFYWSGPDSKPIFLPFVVYEPRDPNFVSESEYVEWEEFFDGLSEPIKSKIIFHLDIFR